MARRRKPPEESGGTSQAWLVTFCDLLTLLITFFVLLISMSSMDSQKLRKAFGFFRGAFAALETGKGMSEAQVNLRTNAQPKAPLRETLGASPDMLDHATLRIRIRRVVKRVVELTAAVRKAHESDGVGLRPLDEMTLDLLQETQPIRVHRKPSRLTLDLHLGLLFVDGSPILRQGSGKLLGEIAALAGAGALISRVQTPLGEHGAQTAYFSPWDLAVWRSATLVRHVRRAGDATRQAAAGVLPQKQSKHVKLVFVFKT